MFLEATEECLALPSLVMPETLFEMVLKVLPLLCQQPLLLPCCSSTLSTLVGESFEALLPVLPVPLSSGQLWGWLQDCERC